VSEVSVPNPFVGQLLDGRYRIVREIAVGGMSAVYEGIHVKIGRTVAIKVLHRDMASDPDAVGRFLNEARAVGTFGHPNIVASTDFGELPGNVPYLVLEYLHGQTLTNEIATNGPMSVRRSVGIALQVASALDAAHARGVVHRDLKSDNIFLINQDGNPDHVKVLDFGISKFLAATDLSPKTRRGLTMGTPEFMSPEQIADPQAVDARTDVYALGVVMYHALTGQPPFGFLPLQTLLTQIVLEPPPPIEREDLPDGVRAVVFKALAKSPDERFANMREMGMELERFSSLVFASEPRSGADGVPVTVSGGRSSAFSGRVKTPGLGVTVRSVSLSSAISASRAKTSDKTSEVKASVETKPIPPEVQKAKRPFGVFVAGALVASALALGGFLLLRPLGAPAPVSGRVAIPVVPSATPSPAPVVAAPPVPLKISSPTSHARVTLRGRTHLLPFGDQAKPGSQPEIVELTAPGHEGKRFWITFDRPTQLQAELRPGRGMTEATAEETLIALGEPSVDGADSGSESSGSRPSGSRHSSGARPRAVGGSGSKVATSPPTQASGLTAASASAGPNAPSLAPAAFNVARTEPSAEAQTGAAGAAPPSAGPPKAEPPRGPEAVAAGAVSAPSSAKAPPLSAVAKGRPVGSTVSSPPVPSVGPSAPAGGTVAGTVDPAKTQAVVRSHLPEVQGCYERGRMDDPELRGRVTVRITIAPTGSVAATALDSSTIGDSRVETCILSAVRGWKFPAPNGGGAVISYPFNLR
jgi:eukaryotic-like serine/threonine-protein kinase